MTFDSIKFNINTTIPLEIAMPQEQKTLVLWLLSAALLSSIFFGPALLVGAGLCLAGLLYFIKRLPRS